MLQKYAIKLNALYENIITYMPFVLITLFPLIVLPFWEIQFAYAKVGFYLLVVWVFLKTYLFVSYKKKEYILPRPAVLYALGAFLLVEVLVAIASIRGFSLSTFSNGVGIDSLQIVFLLVLTLCGAVLYRTYQTKTKPWTVIIPLAVALYMALFHVCRALFGVGFLSFGFFNQITSNVIGTFSDLHIYAGAALLSVVLLFEYVTLKNAYRWLLIVSTFFLTLLAILSNFYVLVHVFGSFSISAIHILLVTCAVLVGVYVALEKKLPRLLFGVTVVLGLCTIFSYSLGNFISSTVPFAKNETLDVRVGAPASFDVIESSYARNFKQMILGSGQGTYYTLWHKYKNTNLVDSVNSTPYWNVDFNASFSWILTLGTTGGVLRLLTWLAFLVGVFVIWFVSCMSRNTERYIYATVTLYFWLYLALYTPGVVILVLSFVFLGFSIGVPQGESTEFNTEMGRIENKGINLKIKAIQALFFGTQRQVITQRSIKNRLGEIVCIFAISVGVLLCIFSFAQKYIGSVHANRALKIIQQNQTAIDSSSAEIRQAISWNPAHEYYRFLADLSLAVPTRVIMSGAVFSESDIEYVGTAIKAVGEMLGPDSDSPDYQDWIEVGKVYEVATFSNAFGTSTAPVAFRAYQNAILLAPTHPTPYYLLARVYWYAGEREKGLEVVKEALMLRPTYPEALRLYTELNATSSRSLGKIRTP